MRRAGLVGWLAAASVLLPAAASGREYTTEVVIRSEDDLYDLADAGELTDEEVDLLVALLHRPMDVNRADCWLLYDLPQLGWAVVDAIIAWRAGRGPFKAVDELRQVPGMTEELLAAIEPFITVAPVATPTEEAPLWEAEARTGVVFEGDMPPDLRSNGAPDKLPSGYLALEAQGFDHFAAGVELMWRPLVTPVWDQSSGQMFETAAPCGADANYACIPETVGLTAAYAMAQWDIWRVIVGTYTIGFGQRLTMDHTGQDYPRGFRERISRTVDRDDGSVRPGQRTLRGAAVTLDGLDTPIGWLDVTAFGSWQHHDLYRNNLEILADDHFGGGASLVCDSDSDCPAGYSCRTEGVCATSAVYEVDRARSFAFFSIDDAYSELLGGANVTFNFDERSRVGATAYRSHVDWNFPAEAHVRFARGDRYPRRRDFGAFGVDGRFGAGVVDVGAEVGLSDRGAPAAVAESIVTPTDWLELTVRAWWYGRDYDNPHSRSTARGLLTMGTSQRNQAGSRLQALWRPMTGLRLFTTMEVAVQPEREVIGGVRPWVADPTALLHLRQSAYWAINKYEELSFEVDYDDHDLSETGRGTGCRRRVLVPAPDGGVIEGPPAQNCGFYESPGLEEAVDIDPTIGDLLVRGIGRGERLRLGLGSTTRLWGITFNVRGTFAIVDAVGDEFERAYDYEGYVRTALSSPLWPDARGQLAFKYWPRQTSSNSDDDLSGYVGLSQRLLDAFSIEVVYGVTGTARTEGLDLRHFGALQLGAAF